MGAKKAGGGHQEHAHGRDEDNADILRQVFASATTLADEDMVPSNLGLVAGRKSLGRRVSFAATAKVRLFDNSRPGERTDGAADDAGANVADPLTEAAAADSRRMSFASDAQAEHGDEHEHENEPVGNRPPFLFSPPPPSAGDGRAMSIVKSPESVSSFEVDVKEGTDMSLLLEDDVEVDDAGGPFVAGFDDDAAATCRRQSDMDFTDVVPLGHAAVRLADAVAGSVRHSMDFTTVIGGLLLGSPPQALSLQAGDGTSPTRVRDDSHNLFSPSPFWHQRGPGAGGHSPAKRRPSDMSMVLDDDDNDAGVSVGLSAPPRGFAFTASPVEAMASPPQHSPASEELFRQLINPERVLDDCVMAAEQESVMLTVRESAMLVERESASARAQENAAGMGARAQADGNRHCGGTQEILDPQNNGLMAAIAADAPASPGAQPELCDVRDFLNRHGIRFLDSLTSLQRRETNSRPRDSSVAAVPGRALAVQAISVPEAELVESAANHLVSKIVGTRERQERLAARFNVAPPPIYGLSQTMPEEQVGLRLKTLKSVARLTSKQEWYQWRRLTLEAAVNSAIECNLQTLLRLESELDSALCCLDGAGDGDHAGNDAVGRLGDLEAYLDEHLELWRRRQHSRLDSGARERAALLQAELRAGEYQLEGLQAELGQIGAEETRLREQIVALQAEKRTLAARLQAGQDALRAAPDVDIGSLHDVRSQLAIATAVQGWRFVHLSAGVDDAVESGAKRAAADGPTCRPAGEAIIEWQRGGPLQIKFDLVLMLSGCDGAGDLGLSVRSVQVMAAMAQSRLLRHAVPRLLKVEWGHALPKTVAMVADRLDRLVHLDKDLQTAAMQCDIGLGDGDCTEAAGPDAHGSDVSAAAPEGILLRLRFFNYEHKAKLAVDVLCDVTGCSQDSLRGPDYSLRLHRINVEYGRPALPELIRRCFTASVLHVGAQQNVLLPLVAHISQLLSHSSAG